MAKRVKYCKAWVENTNARCTNKAKWGTNYCGLHYPKKKIVTTLFGWFLTSMAGIILALFFQDPLIQILSKCPLLYRIDKKMPVIEKKTPDIETSKVIDKNTKTFNVSFYDKDSGIELSKSYIKISCKGKNMYEPLEGQLDKTNSNLHLTLDKELKYGEYLFEVVLVDKADNKNEFRAPFVVREKDELTFSVVGYGALGNASVSDRKIFNSFLENKKKFLENLEPYICKLHIGNKDNIAILRNIYLTVNMSGGAFFSWEQVGNLNAKGFNVYGTEFIDKRVKGLGYTSQNFLNIDELGPRGFLTLYVLIGQSKSLPKSKFKVWKGITIYGTYLSEGYGSSENRKVERQISKKDFKYLK